jgi:hypothetical protein
MEQKLCRICGKLKDIDNFAKNDKMKDGHRNECNDCKNKLYNDKNKIRNRNLEKEIKTEGNKVCCICGEFKSLLEYHVKRGTPDGRRRECKECVKEIQKKYKEVPGFKEKQKEYDKNRYEEIKDKILERKKEYHIENQEKISIKKKEYRNTPEFKIQDRKWRSENKERLAQLQANYRKKYPHIIAWRSVLYSTLKRINTPKEGHTISLLGYSALDLKNHIQSLFADGMSWDNHGKWHIDHITAVENFPDDADIKEVCALENLQPLWAFENLSKNKF